MKKASIVIPVFNEEQNILPLFENIRHAMAELDYEVIFVDDGSSDGTANTIRSITDETVHLIQFKKNYGQSAALSAGIEFASAEYIVTMDGDQQNDPADIPGMIHVADDEDLDMVMGIRSNRKDDFLLRKIPSFAANRIIIRMTGVKIKDNGCALKVIKAEQAKNLRIYGEMHRFIAVLAALDGARISQVSVNHHPRTHGKSKYGLRRTTRVLSDLIVLLFNKRYLQRPMHFFGFWGALIFLIGLVINIYLLILKAQGLDIWGKPLLLLGIVLLLFGFQVITLGIMAELLMRTYYESQNKHPYNIRNIFKGGKKVD
jgi:glycosyltransferase involved in cell wall biosynthesis